MKSAIRRLDAMGWKKKGLIVRPNPKYDWMVSHAMLPVPDWLHDDVYRVYFSGRDRKNRSLIGYAVIDLTNPNRVLEFSRSPVLGLGALGCFDDNGVTPSWIVNRGSEKYLYYIGWNKRSTVRMYLATGLAISEDGGETFNRVSQAPILDRTHREPYILNTAPCVLVEDELWRMWYVSGIDWIHKDLPCYHIKYAESQDGISWNRTGRVCVDLAHPREHALARPCVLKEKGRYKMWYSYKGPSYRIGYAESDDGLSWKRLDARAGIQVSRSGWDSEMIEYAYVFIHEGTYYMLYNGNDYGRDGFGLAVLEEE